MKTNTAGRGWVWAVVLAAGVAALSGCTTYQLGSTLPRGLTSVHVPTAQNQSGEPQIETEVTRAVIRELQRDGTLAVAAAGAADSRLDITLVAFKLSPLRTERDSTRTTREYRMSIVADITLYKNGAEAPLLQRRVRGEATFDFVGDLASSKQQELPEAARDLAHDIVEAIVEFW